MDWGKWITIGLAACGPAGLIGFIMLLPQIKNLQANTTKVEAEAGLTGITGATTLSAAALAQMQAAISQVDSLTQRVSLLERREEQHRALAMRHEAWDRQVLLRLQGLGVHDMPAAPPLFAEPTTTGATT